MGLDAIMSVSPAWPNQRMNMPMSRGSQGCVQVGPSYWPACDVSMFCTRTLGKPARGVPDCCR